MQCWLRHAYVYAYRPLVFMANIRQSFSDYPEACAVQGKPETRGDQFFAEAKRLWEKEKGANSLANCGALCMMAIT
jgi:hypothetical protein